MYIAQTNINGITHYYIRDSYRDGGHFLSRDLIDLGTNPAEHLIYFVFSILFLIIITSGCASRVSYQFVNDSLRPSEYMRFFDELDSAVYRSGTRNGAYFEVSRAFHTCVPTVFSFL